MSEGALHQDSSRFQLPVTTYTTIQLLLLLFSLLHNFSPSIYLLLIQVTELCSQLAASALCFITASKELEASRKSITPITATYLLGQKQSIGGNELYAFSNTFSLLIV